jgi:hypothetical protein
MDHKIKDEQEVNYGEKIVDECKVARPGNNIGRNYQISVKPF